MSIPPLRVATFNIHHGAGRDGKADIGRAAEVIRGLAVDLIALQELDVGLRRSRNVDQPAELADLLGMHVYFAPALHLDGGEYGIALVSRDEFRGAVERLPRVKDEEPRVAIVAGWRQIGIVTTHLSRSAESRGIQTAKLADLIGKLGTPAIILGDLNQTAKALGPLTGAGLTPVKAPKGPLQVLPRRQIDHILITKDMTVTKAWTVPTSVSDHVPLVAEIVAPDA